MKSLYLFLLIVLIGLSNVLVSAAQCVVCVVRLEPVACSTFVANRPGYDECICLGLCSCEGPCTTIEIGYFDKTNDYPALLSGIRHYVSSKSGLVELGIDDESRKSVWEHIAMNFSPFMHYSDSYIDDDVIYI